MENGSVSSSIVNGIATITFGHPQSNSLPGEILRALANEIRSIGSSKEVRVIILKSIGDKTFCAGASFDELVAIDNLVDVVAKLREENKLFIIQLLVLLDQLKQTFFYL